MCLWMGVLPYMSHLGMCQRVGFFAPFCLKTVIDFAHCGQKSCMVFEGITGVYKRILSFQIQMGRKEKNANSKWILRNFFFCFCSILI